jgi:hypothetical protein
MSRLCAFAEQTIPALRHPLRDRGDGRATRQPQGLGPEACLSVRRKVSLSRARRRKARGRAASGWAKRAGGRVVCGVKRIRSLYLPWMTGVTPKLSPTVPPKGLASFSTINAATMRLCRADLPVFAHSSRLEAAPTAFVLTEPPARREGRPYQRWQQVVRA